MPDVPAVAFERVLAFERLVASLSTTFIHAPAALVDAHVLEAITRVAEFLELDRSQVAQVASGGLQITHQWARDEAWPCGSVHPGEGCSGSDSQGTAR